jgi:hypothetical protein
MEGCVSPARLGILEIRFKMLDFEGKQNSFETILYAFPLRWYNNDDIMQMLWFHWSTSALSPSWNEDQSVIRQILQFWKVTLSPIFWSLAWLRRFCFAFSCSVCSSIVYFSASVCWLFSAAFFFLECQMTTVYFSGCNLNGFRFALKCTVSLKISVKNENMTLVFNYTVLESF